MPSEQSKQPGELLREIPVEARNTRLFAPLSGVACGAVITAAGMGRLFVGDGKPDVWARSLLAAGALMLVASTIFALRVLRQLPTAADDCARYGRHIVGLTFVLLVTGLCNAAGMSALALEGGLDFSAASLIAASDTTKVTEADTNRTTALENRKKAERELRDVNKALGRAQAVAAQACASAMPPPSSATEASAAPTSVASPPAAPAAEPDDPCTRARATVMAREDELDVKRDQLADAREKFDATEAACAEARLTKKRALFFLLSVSTMTSLFGAAFYVVNQVREKRPAYSPTDPGSTPLAGSGGPSVVRDGPHEGTTVTATAIVRAADDGSNGNAAASLGAGPSTVKTHGEAAVAGSPATAIARMSLTAPKAHEEPFDVHKFWSGAFFRVGEAVLFTFTFFWLLWSSQSTQYAIWLPVLALFVGMFVKTGETIIFRLGMRILSAAEALLPAGSSERSAATVQVADGTGATETLGVSVRDGKAQPRLSN